ncbi:MAG TPA: tyrosine-type recombinase/integrase [Ktedonobacteraceae bacterium]|nr:tyrosine-type recombinase/integrase [Ktedonobacteraceae bacterium]
MTEILEQRLTAYNAWLDRQPLAAKTRIAYRLQVHQYGVSLAQRPPMADDPLRTPFARDYAIRDDKTYLKTERQAKPPSVNLALAALDHFHQFIGNDRPQVQRESLPAQAPRALKPEEQKALLRAIEHTSSVQDRAIAQLLFYTAIRLGECAALNLDDMRVSARKGVVIIRSGKGDTYREIPLNTEVREALRIWLKERSKRFSQTSDPAVFLNPKGERLSARSIDLIIRHIGADARLELSAHILRHICLTNLVRRGNDAAL